MKTLDAVIHGYECCLAINCAECPYANWNNTDVVRCDPTDKDDDALHYLEEYKGLSEMWNNRLDAEQKNNPLTWQELTQMIGKPVWDEGKTVKHWTIITGIYYDDLNEGYVLLTYYSERNGAQTIRRKRSTMGKTWNAYRKERE